MGAIGWEGSLSWTSVTITLNSVADGALAMSSTDITNGTAADLYMDVSLVLGSITTSGAPAVELHMAALMNDGTNLADSAISGASMVAVLPVTTGASIKRVLFSPPRSVLLVPPGTFRIGIGNRTGVTFAGSGNSLHYRLYSLNAA